MHQPVLLNEVVEFLRVRPEGRYVDGTLGLGGHAEAILLRLGPKGRLLGLDVDAENLALAKNRLQPFGTLAETRQVNFRGLQTALRGSGWNEVEGMVFDLGVSSRQLEDGKRGFSFRRPGPLDMRLDPSQPETALSLLRKAGEDQLAALFSSFGEKRAARRLSRYLLHDIAAGKIQTTEDLASFCRRVLGQHGKTHPATRVFLALRCLVNDELEALSDMLQAAPSFLSVGGRLAIISFHSLEDRLVKERFRDLAKNGSGEKRFSLVTKKPVVPSAREAHENPRARSAKLRVVERAA